MTQINKSVETLVKTLVPTFSKFQFDAVITDKGRSVEFFVWIDGEKLQCYELADTGKIDESQMENLFDSFAEVVRKSDEYEKGKVNKISFTC